MIVKALIQGIITKEGRNLGSDITISFVNKSNGKRLSDKEKIQIIKVVEDWLSGVKEEFGSGV